MKEDKVKLPEMVAGWLIYCKGMLLSLDFALNQYSNGAEEETVQKLSSWFEEDGNVDLFKYAWDNGFEIVSA